MMMRKGFVVMPALIALGTTAAATSRCLEQEACKIQEVIDGDTFTCTDGRTIRLLLIDAPERTQRPYGNMARDVLLDLAPPGTWVGIKTDAETYDRYGRVLAYAWRGDGLFLNRWLIANGYAVLLVNAPNGRYAHEFRQLQREAQLMGKGLWISRGFRCLPVNHRDGKC